MLYLPFFLRLIQLCQIWTSILDYFEKNITIWLFFNFKLQKAITPKKFSKSTWVYDMCISYKWGSFTPSSKKYFFLVLMYYHWQVVSGQTKCLWKAGDKICGQWQNYDTDLMFIFVFIVIIVNLLIMIWENHFNRLKSMYR